MRPGRSNAKGGGYERRIAKRLSAWILGRNTDSPILWRTASSGGRATQLRKQRKRADSQAGDLGVIDKAAQPFINQFFVECKFVKSLKLNTIFADGVDRTGIIGHWLKARAQARAHGKAPILFCRENRGADLVVIGSRGMKLLGLNDPLLSGAFIAHLPQLDVFVYSLDAFVKIAVPPE